MSANDIAEIKADLRTLFGKVEVLTKAVVRLTTIAEVQKVMNKERLIYIGLIVSTAGYIVKDLI